MSGKVEDGYHTLSELRRHNELLSCAADDPLGANAVRTMPEHFVSYLSTESNKQTADGHLAPPPIEKKATHLEEEEIKYGTFSTRLESGQIIVTFAATVIVFIIGLFYLIQFLINSNK